jgi:hypothetical protein
VNHVFDLSDSSVEDSAEGETFKSSNSTCLICCGFAVQLLANIMEKLGLSSQADQTLSSLLTVNDS